VEGSRYFQSSLLYKENGFKEKKTAEELIDTLKKEEPFQGRAEKVERKKEKKNPPLLYNLAELQNECSRMFKISPDAALKIVQELYEKKLVTYPRTDARVLSSAVAKEIHKNIQGLRAFGPAQETAGEVLASGSYKTIARSKYVNDKAITDHYAIIPTGQGLSALRSVSPLSVSVYQLIVKRFLSIFLPPAVYQKVSVTIAVGTERFFASFKVLEEEGYLKLYRKAENAPKEAVERDTGKEEKEEGKEKNKEESFDMEFFPCVYVCMCVCPCVCMCVCVYVCMCVCPCVCVCVYVWL